MGVSRGLSAVASGTLSFADRLQEIHRLSPKKGDDLRFAIVFTHDEPNGSSGGETAGE